MDISFFTVLISNGISEKGARKEQYLVFDLEELDRLDQEQLQIVIFLSKRPIYCMSRK